MRSRRSISLSVTLFYYQFVRNNGFTGKTVIPFCTSSSSGIGQSGENLAEMAGAGDWQKGQQFSGSASADDIQEWINSLNPG